MSYRHVLKPRGDLVTQAAKLGLSYVPVIGPLLSQFLPTETPGILFGDASAPFKAWQQGMSRAFQIGRQVSPRAMRMRAITARARFLRRNS